MNINRHNYEEYFILYMDNELGSDDRRMVETFVLQHPDLKEELDLLLQYKLSPDTEILFPGKEELIKVNGETPISLTNYEEWLVLYIDNELNADQRKIVVQFIATNPSVKEELAQLQQTKLQPEQIVFGIKESLYRKEEKFRSLPVRWWRAVAAMLILALGLTTFILLKNKPSGVKEEIVNTTPGSNDKINPDNLAGQVKKETPVIVPDISDNTSNQTAVTDNQKISPVIKQENKNMAVKNNNTVVKDKDKLSANIPSPVKKEEHVIATNDNNKPTNNLPQPINSPNIIKNDAAKADVVDVNIPKEINNTQESLTTTPVTNPSAETSPTKNPDVIFASLEEGGKNKNNRGFFRKITRTFEKRTNMTATDDDRLLVGGLAFKLK